MNQEQASDHIRRTLNATTYVALGKRLDVSPAHLCMIFQGKRMPRAPIMMKMAGALGVSMDQLYRHVKTLKDAREKGAAPLAAAPTA